jgi:hypothetical protein
MGQPFQWVVQRPAIIYDDRSRESWSQGMERLENEYEVRHYLYSMDLTRVRQRLKRWGWSRWERSQGIDYYLKYLLIRWQYPETECPPSEAIALVWQAHILETQSYSECCDRLFGSYLHFTSAARDRPELFDEVTQPLFRAVYGHGVPKIIERPWYRKAMDFVRRWTNRVTSSVAISTLVVTAYSAMLARNDYINGQYEALVKQIRQMVTLEERLAVTCQSNIKEQYPEFFISKLYDMRQDLSEHILSAVGLGLDLKNSGLLSTQATVTLQNFNRRMSRLYYSGMDICEQKLHGWEASERYRKSIVRQLDQSRKQVLWFGSWLDDTTLVMMTGKKPQDSGN